MRGRAEAVARPHTAGPVLANDADARCTQFLVGLKKLRAALPSAARLAALRTPSSDARAWVLQDAAKRARLDAERRALERHDSGKDREEALSREEVIRRLRLLGQPITLFGEVRCPDGRAARLLRIVHALHPACVKPGDRPCSGSQQQSNLL